MGSSPPLEVQGPLGLQLARGPVDVECLHASAAQRVGQYVVVCVGGRHRGADVRARCGVLRHLSRRNSLNIIHDEVLVVGELGGVVAAPVRLHRVFRVHHGRLAGALGVGVAHRRPQVVVDVALAHGIGRRVAG